MLNLIIRTIALYLTVVASIRIMGKRQIGELQPSELVVAIMISDLASVPMQDMKIPLVSGILPVLTLIFAEVIMSYMSLRSRKMRTIISGEPSIVIYDGHINERELKKLRFNINDLLEELRLNNYHDISDVAVAVIETSGKLSVIPKEKARGVTVEDMAGKSKAHEGLPCMLISDGKIDDEELKRSKKSKKWLEKELEKNGIYDIKTVFIASLDAEGKLYLQKKRGGG